LQIGANNGDTLAVALTNNTAATLAVGTNITTQATASAVITALDASINTVSTNGSNLGAMQNRLDSVTHSLAVASENTAAANSRIAGADIASSMSELDRSQILQQAGVSVLAQANQAPSRVLQLLK
jgi:flagellin